MAPEPTPARRAAAQTARSAPTDTRTSTRGDPSQPYWKGKRQAHNRNDRREIAFFAGAPAVLLMTVEGYERLSMMSIEKDHTYGGDRCSV
jgi:hypothetical protein